MTSHLFGGVWCGGNSTYAMRRTVNDIGPSRIATDIIIPAFYIDDMLASVMSKAEAAGVIQSSRETFRFGGFSLTKFVRQWLWVVGWDWRIWSSCWSEITHTGCLSKTIGIQWNVDRDMLFCVSRPVMEQTAVRHRVALSQIASTYDPLGLISTIVYEGREVSGSHESEAVLGSAFATRCCTEMGCLIEIFESCSCHSIQRYVIPAGFTNDVTELHHFCGGSQVGFGACSYIILVGPGKIQVALVTGKYHLAPLKQVSIPRLELLAAVVSMVLYGICCPKFSSHAVVVWLIFQLLATQESCVLVATVEISLGGMDPTDWPYHGCSHFGCREDGLKSCAAPDVWSRADVIAKLWARTSKESHFQGVSPIFDGLFIVGGRLRHASILSGLKNSIILPRDHHVTHAIVQEYHENTHLGVEWVLSKIRNKFWIVNARNMVKWVKRTCVIYLCTQLPRIRIWPTWRQRDVCRLWDHSFSYTGLDFYVKVVRSQVTEYGCVWHVSAHQLFILRCPSVSTLIHLEMHSSDFLPEEAPLRKFGHTTRNLVGHHAELKLCVQQSRQNCTCAQATEGGQDI